MGSEAPASADVHDANVAFARDTEAKALEALRARARNHGTRAAIAGALGTLFAAAQFVREIDGPAALRQALGEAEQAALSAASPDADAFAAVSSSMLQ
jgi:hypothetical protein